VINIGIQLEPKYKYVRPASLAEAIQLLNEPGINSKVLAGGTDLMPALRQNAPDFERLVDISRLVELKTIENKGGTVILGAGVTFSEAIESKTLQEAVPFLIEACRMIGSPQIRNVGTIGGNVINAAVCADSLPVFVCLGAIAHLCSLERGRQIPLDRMIIGPNHTCVEPGELLTGLSFEMPPKGTKTAFNKLARGGISRLSMAVMGGVNDKGMVDHVRIVPGAATPRTVRFVDAEAILTGNRPTPDLIHQASCQIAESMLVITGRRWSNEYKERALISLAEQALSRVFPA